VLSKTIQVRVRRQVRPKAKVLRLKHDIGTLRVEQHFPSRLAGDREGEWRMHKVKLKLRRLLVSTGRGCCWARKNRCRDLVYLLRCIVDLDVETRVWGCVRWAFSC